MENTETVRDLARSLQSSISELETALHPIAGRSLEDLTKDCKSPKEEADVLNKYLYCTVSIAFAYLKVQGINTDGHPIMKELDRVKASMKRMKDLEAAQQKSENKKAQSKEEAAEYIQRTLGGASGGAAASNSMKSPAISSSNFQGKHTKFEDDDDSEPELQKEETTPATSSKIAAKNTSSTSEKAQPSKSSSSPQSSKASKNKSQNKVSKPQPKGQRKARPNRR
ncbi:uncharacterized protein CXQ87_000072 [Candidozyma duobushaemuli]|uniref:Exosome complex protein n=2 Tax=Candidozyma TaxID=3303203 RepID=A0ABX8HZD4_9ASCO|nr:uncharacterized protein CXQ87_000072 [[Candida] duobushaemulonis]PVH17191.1 hypothetical protein CXQ87_000072 [[Candida] duobushaemulonis]QWU85852.1 hypothetical protein CA3LBN_000070 [[Candida] haemuloni]